MASVVWGKTSEMGLGIPWSGNCLLNGARIARAGEPDDDVLLDWLQALPDGETVALWHMNEDTWTGRPGEVGDASGKGHHGQAYNGATTTEGWLGRAGSFKAASSRYVRVPYAAELNPAVTTVEAWVCWDGTVSGLQSPMTSRSCLGEYRGWTIYLVPGPNWQVYLGKGSDWWKPISTIRPEANRWQHIALCIDGTKGAEFYVNGARGFTTVTTGYAPNPSAPLFLGCGEDGTGGPLFYFNGLVDEVRVSNSLRYAGGFSPARYPSWGTVTARHMPLGQQRLTAIGWAGSFGEEYGRLTQLEVCDAEAGWVTVAEDPAGLTSPVVGLSCKVIGPDLVRATLTPRADALRSETPRLDWLEVTLEPVLQQPFRASKVRACTLAAQGIHATAVHASTVRAKRHKVTFND